MNINKAKQRYEQEEKKYNDFSQSKFTKYNNPFYYRLVISGAEGTNRTVKRKKVVSTTKQPLGGAKELQIKARREGRMLLVLATRLFIRSCSVVMFLFFCFSN